MVDSGLEEMEGAKGFPPDESERATDSGTEEPERAGGEPPSRVVLALVVGFAVVFLAWTVRQTWRAVFGPF
jgi:hypothetical protein